MLLIPIGLIFVFFYINIHIGSRTVDALPDALGYLLIACNAFKFRQTSYEFAKVLYLSVLLTVYSIIVRFIVPVGIIGVLLSLLELLLQLYLLYLIVCGIEDKEREVDAHLNSKLLHRWRVALSIAWGVSYLLALMGAVTPGIGVVGPIVVAVWAILCVLFLLVLFRTSHRYKLLTSQDEPDSPLL